MIRVRQNRYEITGTGIGWQPWTAMWFSGARLLKHCDDYDVCKLLGRKLGGLEIRMSGFVMNLKASLPRCEPPRNGAGLSKKRGPTLGPGQPGTVCVKSLLDACECYEFSELCSELQCLRGCWTRNLPTRKQV